MSERTACVILAAGKGKRMRSGLAKVLHPICGEPMITYPVALAVARRYRPIVVVVGHQGDEVESCLRARFGERVSFAQQDPPLGTGHALLQAERALAGFRGSLVVLCGDVPLLSARELAALERGARGVAVAFLTCRLADPGRYGRVVRDRSGEVLRIVEHADASAAERAVDEINSGIYRLDARWAFAALRRLRRANAQGEYYLTDLVAAARRAGRGVRGVRLGSAAAVSGINDRRELAAVARACRQRLLERWLAAGVTLVDPATTFIGPRVRLGRDSVIEPGCHLLGDTRIGSGCHLGPAAVLRDAQLAEGVVVRAFCVLEECRIGRGAQVGPFARLRTGSELGPEARVGNFVETKKTRLGRGAKANHLTYLGDATVGEGANVGAGTITCNYDGEHKHPTVIGDGAFIGSDTQLVAPVRVGEGAYVGAGTTLTHDVPPGALAISRVRQRNIPGYAEQRALGRRKAARKVARQGS